MYKTILIHIKIIIAVVFSGCITSCEANDDEQKDLTSILQTSFGYLYLAKHGLEYPYTEDQLNKCIQHNDEPCLKVYNRVMEGKNTIISLPANKALDTTLDIIERACLSKNENIANYTCYGGIMSLYFYNSHEQDAKILARVKKYPKKIQSLIFNSEFLWFRNRPNYKVWVDYISVADIDLSYNNQKHFISDMFRKNIDELEDKPWVLR